MHAWPPPTAASGDHYLRLDCGEGIDLATHDRVRRALTALAVAALPDVDNLHPAYATLGVSFDPRHTDSDTLSEVIAAILRQAAAADLPPRRRIEIPVAYGGANGPDLHDVARHTGLSPEEVMARHSAATYRVFFLGFSPGFGYLGGLPEELATPRLPAPRARVPAGSVAIGGAQTGVYPQATPGGWRLIGRTHLKLFDPLRDPPALLALGDEVLFSPSGDNTDVVADTPACLPASAGGTAGCEVLRPGMLTTVQDLGRPGLAHLGVARGGAADPVSLRIANLLLGNPEHLAALEMTLVGATLRFARDAVVATAGAKLHRRLDGRGVPDWQPVAVRAGEVLELGEVQGGARTYLAVRGGIAVPAVLGSASTHLAGGFGGLEGRALRRGDRLHFGPPPPPCTRRAGPVSTRTRTFVSGTAVLRVLPTAHLCPSDLIALTAAEFTISSRSDRTGVRLDGPRLPTTTGALLTEGVPTGAVQLPPDGHPILMLADHPTTGGYQQLATVIAADIHRLGQLRPGRTVRLELVDSATAAVALAELERVVAGFAAGGQA